MSHRFYQIPPSALEWTCVEDHVGHLADTLSVAKCCKYQLTAGINNAALVFGLNPHHEQEHISGGNENIKNFLPGCRF